MKRALTGLRLSQFLWLITMLVLEALIGQGGEATLQERPWFYMAHAAVALHLLGYIQTVCVVVKFVESGLAGLM